MTVGPVGGMSPKDQTYIFDEDLQRHIAPRIEDIQVQVDGQLINKAACERQWEVQGIKGMTYDGGLFQQELTRRCIHVQVALVHLQKITHLLVEELFDDSIHASTCEQVRTGEVASLQPIVFILKLMNSAEFFDAEVN